MEVILWGMELMEFISLGLFVISLPQYLKFPSIPKLYGLIWTFSVVSISWAVTKLSGNPLPPCWKDSTWTITTFYQGEHTWDARAADFHETCIHSLSFFGI